ncbi:MAG: pseudaminic acid cytidylyltransferase, partial [Lachnospiraceae bacterium]|nr:pseudaminic acid cytidylyltransferase [Lachnospiraceae bacterium]
MCGENKALAIITARGGSKRIPKKNIKDFLGRPIIAYSIEAALKSEVFAEVMVSTDSEEIAEIAKKYGAKVPFMRSEKAASDFATTADVLLEVLEEYEKRGEKFEFFSCIYPTAPFIRAEKLKEAFRKLKESTADEVLPVVSFSYPPQRGYIMKDGFLEMKWKENFSVRSQDLEMMYHDCGQFYFYRTAAYQRRKGLMTDGLLPYVIDELEVQDIDNETDWKLAELKYQL